MTHNNEFVMSKKNFVDIDISGIKKGSAAAANSTEILSQQGFQ
jgi:hypothetical protein